MKSVVIYPTPEVRDLIQLLRPDAVIESYGESGNIAVSLPGEKLTVEQQREASRPKPGSKDCYEIAKERGISPDEAWQQMKAEGWTWAGYSDWGQEVFLPPAVSPEQ